MALKLKPDEEAWLDEYRRALVEKYPGLVEDMIVFHSGDGRYHLPDYTLNTVVILKGSDRETQKEIDFLGHHLAVLSETIPFVWVYSQDEWKHHRLKGSLPYNGDGTSVWPN